MPSPLPLPWPDEGTASLSLENRLLLGLSRPDLPPESRSHLSALLSGEIDWDALIEGATRHGVLPMVWTHLSTLEHSVPSAVIDEMRIRYLALFRMGLQIRGECPRLLRSLADAGVPALAFKGPVVAELAYDNPNSRTCTDLDVFVRKADVPRTLKALHELGFVPRNPLQENYDDRWSTYLPYHRPHGNANGYVRDPGTPGELRLDLHWGFASRYFLCGWDPAGVWKRQQTHPIDGVDVPTFSDVDTLIFLCMHAAKDNYDRLRLVCDIAALMRSHPTVDIAAALTIARRAGCVRMLRLGMTLAHVLLDAPLPDACRFWAAKPSTASLIRQAVELLFAPRHGIAGIVQRSRFHLQVRDQRRDAIGTIFYQIELSLHTLLGRLRPESSSTAVPASLPSQ